MPNKSSFTLSDIGSFFVAGRSAREGGVARAYVQYFIPEPARYLPVLFVHGGGGLTGSCWETTLEGRPGWLPRFLRAGWPCYIVDNVGHGRGIVGQLPGVWEGISTPRVNQQAWDIFRIGVSENRESAIPFQDSQFPVELFNDDPPTPQWLTEVSPSVAALVAAVRRIGRCSIVSHSGGARFTTEVAGLASDVIASVLIEPHTLPPSGPPEGIARQLLVGGDYLDRSPIWSGARDGWRKYHATAIAAGAPVELWELPARGLHGNGHMLMMERNSDATADLVMDWLERSDTKSS